MAFLSALDPPLQKESRDRAPAHRRARTRGSLPRPRDIRQLIERNTEEWERQPLPCHTAMVDRPQGGGRPAIEILAEPGAGAFGRRVPALAPRPGATPTGA